MAHKFFTSIKARFFSNASSRAVDIGVDGDAEPRLAIDAGGRITWGSGGEAGDVYIQRTGTEAVNFVGDVGVNTAAPAHQLDVSGSIGTPDYIAFNTAVSELAEAEGELGWNNEDGTLDLVLKGENVVLQVGQETVVRVFNASGVNLGNGTAVAISGAQGQRIAVVKADVSDGSSIISNHAIGLTTETINAGSEGYVAISGTVRRVTTTGWAAGDVLYVDPETPGGLTNVRPSAPDHAVVIGYVQRTSTGGGNNGSIFVNTRQGEHLEWLHDVSISGAATGEFLRYDDDAGVWVNDVADPPVSVVSTFPVSPSEGDLWYDDTSGSTYIYYDQYWVEIGASMVEATGDPTFISDTQPVSSSPYVWWDTSDPEKLTLWIEDGIYGS